MTILSIALTILCLLGWGLYINQRKKHVDIISVNQVIQRQNQELDNQYKSKQDKLNQIQVSIINQNSVLQDVINNTETLKSNAQQMAREEHQRTLELLEIEYQRKEDNLKSELQEKENEFNKQKSIYDDEIAQKQEILNDLKNKYAARMEAQLREEEIKSKENYYKLDISEQDKQDIQCLRELQGRLGRKDAIDKLIWEVYYKPAYDALMPRIMPAAGKVCGIYKITNITTGMIYIGQSVDIKERFRQHVKTALASIPATNKLYQAMKQYGLYDFTFEVLEKDIPRIKLNERETYWIDFYDTKKFGLNKTVGGS